MDHLPLGHYWFRVNLSWGYTSKNQTPCQPTNTHTHTLPFYRLELSDVEVVFQLNQALKGRKGHGSTSGQSRGETQLMLSGRAGVPKYLQLCTVSPQTLSTPHIKFGNHYTRRMGPSSNMHMNRKRRARTAGNQMTPKHTEKIFLDGPRPYADEHELI